MVVVGPGVVAGGAGAVTVGNDGTPPSLCDPPPEQAAREATVSGTIAATIHRRATTFVPYTAYMVSQRDVRLVPWRRKIRALRAWTGLSQPLLNSVSERDMRC